MSEKPREYDQYVANWVTPALAPDNRTAVIHPQTVLDSPQGVAKALRQLVLDNVRVVVPRTEKIGG